MEELLAADFPDCDDESSSSSEDVLEDSSDQDQFDNNEETGSSEPRVHDIGIQCCCQPVTLRSVAVQTEDSKQKKGKANVTPTPIQNEPYMYVPPYVDAVQWKVLKDHTYSLPACPSSVFPTYDDNFFSTISFTQLHKEDPRLENDDDNVDGHVSDTDDEVDDEDLDPHWKFPPKGKHYGDADEDDDDDDEESEDEFPENPGNEKKFVVFNSNLNNLFKRCQECGDVVIEQKRKTVGSMLSVELVCQSGCKMTWESQPVVKRKPLGNLLLAASILFTGNNFAAISRLASCFNLQFFSESVFYDTQRKYLFPVVNEAWEAESQRQVDRLTSKEVVNLDGDGRCDSPGHSAKYGTYTLMDEDSGDVVAFNVVQVSEVSSSNAMEKEGFSRCLQDLEEKGIMINRIATDRHVSISSSMKKDFPHINHQYDVWHLSKWVVKKLTNKAKQKGCEELAPWIQSISNHLWWCAATCDGNVQLLREKWKSVLDHVANKHKWSGNTLFHQCCHRRISSSEAKQICWLKPGSQAHIALEEVVLNKKLLKDLAKLTSVTLVKLRCTIQ